MNFNELNLNSNLLRAIEEMGFTEASPIQEQAIPCALTGGDLVGQAQTGTGKTAAYGLPMLQMADPEDRSVQGLVLCPTRELAMQVADEMRKMAKYLHGIRIQPIYGGQDINRQIKAIKGGVTIIVGTPGRVMDHMRRKTLRFDDLKMITLDEADEMLNMGFREDIETILKETNEDRQTLLFSATMPKPIMDIAKTYQKDAQIVRIAKKELTVNNINQTYYKIRRQDRTEALCRLLDVHQPKLSVVFCNTKRGVEDLVLELQERGYSAEGLHGDLNQQQRDRVMGAFRKNITDILVATDVAARGIDVDDVDAVFNYELPQDDEYYVHRIGRTGRAGRTGNAFSFVSSKDFYRLKTIQRYCKTVIEPASIPSGREVRKMRFDKVFRKVQNTMETHKLDSYVERLMKKCEETDVSPVQVAAALIKMELGDEIMREVQVDTKTDANAPAKRNRAIGREKRKGYDRLFLNVGTRSHVRPGDILGAIAGESGIAGKKIGTIDMHEKFSFVEIPRELSKKVIQAMSRAKIKGNSIHMEIAKDTKGDHKRS